MFAVVCIGFNFVLLPICLSFVCGFVFVVLWLVFGYFEKDERTKKEKRLNKPNEETTNKNNEKQQTTQTQTIKQQTTIEKKTTVKQQT